MERCQVCIHGLTRASCVGYLVVFLSPLILCTGGCNQEVGQQPMGGPRVETVPVTGTVLVDNKPVDGIAVLFLRVSEKGVDFPVPEPEGITDENGMIQVSTYSTGDGGVPGVYKVCFVWNLGNDRFRGKYDKKEKSKFTVTIPDEAIDGPFDVGTFELSSVSAVDDTILPIASYRFGQSHEPLTVVEEMVREAVNSPGDADRLAGNLALLLAMDATPDAKRFVCRQLEILGSPESVSALSALLLDEELSDMARYALEAIDDASAGQALLEALRQSEGRIQVGVINSLGSRADEAATLELVKRITDADVAVAEAAISALGRIGGEEAVTALARGRKNVSAPLRAHLMDTWLSSADGFLASGQSDRARAIYESAYVSNEPIWIRVAAFAGLVATDSSRAVQRVLNELAGPQPELQAAALGCVRELTGVEATQGFVDLLLQLPAEQQAQLLAALGDRGDRAALPSVMTAIESENQKIRTAALRALGMLGDAEAVSQLARFAAQATGAEQEAARTSLAILRGTEVDGAIRNLMTDADAKTRAELIACLGPRNAVWAVEMLKESVRGPDARIRVASLKALGELAGQDDMRILVGLLFQATSAEELDAVSKTVLATSYRISDSERRVEDLVAALSLADVPDTRIPVMELLSRIGGPTAMAAVGSLTQDDDATVSDAAVQALADWSGRDAMPSLLEIVRTSDNPEHRVTALQGYVRLLRRMSPRTSEDLLRQYQEAFALATRVQEKRQILAGMRSVRVAPTLYFILPMLNDKELGKDAAMTAVYLSGLGRRTKIGDKDAVAAMKRVLEISQDEEVRSMAEMVLQTRTGH